MQFALSTKLKFNELFTTRELLLLNTVGKMAEQHIEEGIASCVRRYHIYNKVWAATVGEILSCARETGNVVDRYTVSVLKEGKIVVHFLEKLSKVYSLFLQCGGSISCEIAGAKRYSRDLQQGVGEPRVF